MKKLLRAKTSATTDHCQFSLETANSPPASTAPGPGPANLRVAEDRCSLSFGIPESDPTGPGRLGRAQTHQRDKAWVQVEFR